jgi:CDP-diacylglycerol--glycerol-3-phosphate 3-phosphatidyltransferase
VGVFDVSVHPQILNVPNVFTAARLLLTIVVFVLVPLRCYGAGFILFVLAAATDWVDGYWARRFNQVTQLGRIFDPFVDKIIVCGTFIFLAAEPVSGLAPWMAVVVVGREMLVTVLRSAIEQSGGDFSAKMSGKLKMVFQCIAVGGGLLNLMYGSPAQTPTWLIWAMPAAVWLAMFLTVYSGVVYVIAAAKLLRAS